MAARHEDLRITEHLPSEVLAEMIPLLVPLVMTYALEESQYENPEKTTREEFDYSDTTARVLLAWKKKKVVGSLIQVNITENLDLEVPNEIAIVEIGGFVVSPEYRQNGVGTSLVEEMIENFNLPVVMGLTNRASALAARLAIFSSHDCDTFFGPNKIVDGQLIRTDEHRIVVEPYVDMLGLTPNKNDKYIYPYNKYGLSRQAPDLSRYPEPIGLAMEDLIKRQKESNDTLLSTLVSAPQGVLDLLARVAA